VEEPRLHGALRELVPEADSGPVPLEDPSLDAFVEFGDPVTRDVEKFTLTRLSQHGRGAHDGLGTLRKACDPSQYGVAHACRGVDTTAGQGLGHEKGVASRRAMQGERIDPGLGREGAHGLEGERRHDQLGDVLPCEIAKSEA
jgi:hypothetical protein